MKKITRTELDHILRQHKLWVKSNGVNGDRAHLSGANLRRAKLNCAHLQGANIQGANLCGAHLQDADLRNADLWDADLQHANLQGANLHGASLRSTDLRFARLDVNIRDCLSFQYTLATPDALPWLILHPKWSEWKRTVMIYPG